MGLLNWMKQRFGVEPEDVVRRKDFNDLRDHALWLEVRVDDLTAELDWAHEYIESLDTAERDEARTRHPSQPPAQEVARGFLNDLDRIRALPEHHF